MDKNIINELVSILGSENVLTSKEDKINYSYDATPDVQRYEPDVVVTPSSKDEVVKLVKLASKYKVPLVTRGSGTNLSGG